MTWQIALAIHSFFAILRSGIQKKIVVTVHPIVLLFLVICYMLVEVFFLILFFTGNFPTIHVPILFIGVLFGISTACLFSAIKISLSQTSVFASYAMVVSMILSAFFLGEWTLFNPVSFIGQKTLGGLVLATVALALITKPKKKSIEGWNKKWLILMFLYIIFDGTGQFFNKLVLSNTDPYETLFSTLLGMIPTVFIITRVQKLNLKVTRKNHRWIFVESLAEIGFAIFLLTALKFGPLSIIFPVQKLAVLIGGMLLGLFLFNEARNYSRVNLAGMLVGIAGILLLVV